MVFYTLFSGQGTNVLSAALDAMNPFNLAAAEIVERVIAAGYRSQVDTPHHHAQSPWGKVVEVQRDGQMFRVSTSEIDETITVQEVREEPY